jgi:hypothetical protein
MEPDMKHCITLAALTVGAALLVGCGKETATPIAAPGSAPANPAVNLQPQAVASAPVKQAVHVPVNSAPDQVVEVFLNALRNGDEATTASLLTTKAREETAKHDIAVAPESAPHASYKVSAAQILPDNPAGAHVTSIWTENYQQQQPDGSITQEAITYEIVWVLRNEPQIGWRVAGMAVEIAPGQEPEFMNFEDPVDMLAKRTAAIAASNAVEAANATGENLGQNPPASGPEAGVQSAQQPAQQPPTTLR